MNDYNAGVLEGLRLAAKLADDLGDGVGDGETLAGRDRARAWGQRRMATRVANAIEDQIIAAGGQPEVRPTLDEGVHIDRDGRAGG
jgi:hypothetical protein